MILTGQQLLHIGFHFQAPFPNVKIIEGVVSTYSVDWVRYSTHCYLIVTDHHPTVIQKALLAIPNMDSSFLMVCAVDPTITNIDGYLPQWIWDWVNKHFQSPLQQLSLLLGPPKL
jgi:hypothetical protein